MRSVVVDASAGVQLILGGVDGRSLADQLAFPARVWVPEHYYLEVAGTLRRLERRRQLVGGEASGLLDEALYGNAVRVTLRALLGAAWARRGHVTVADALYVVLAEMLGATLVTADRRLAKAPGLRVPTITP